MTSKRHTHYCTYPKVAVQWLNEALSFYETFLLGRWFNTAIPRSGRIECDSDYFTTHKKDSTLIRLTMTKTTFYLSTVLVLVLSYYNRQHKENLFVIERSIEQIKSDLITENKLETTEIICDTVYPSKGYKITLTTFASSNGDETVLNETIPNTIFSFSKKTKGQYLQIFTDSVFSTVKKVRFADFNNDKVNDILIQNYSDANSNWTYYLYLVDTVQNKLKKVNGFEEIKNPKYLPQYNLIDNYVMSGKIWTSFYKIMGDTIKNFNIVIYDNQTDDGSYEREYKKAIRKIFAKGKNRR